MTTPRSRARLGTAILLLVIVALGFVLVARQRREARLRAALALFENRANRSSYGRLNSLDLSLKWPDQATLNEVIKQVGFITNRPGFAGRRRLSLPIYVDPIGLQEAGQSLTSRVIGPPPKNSLTIQEHLRRVLEPLGLAYQVKDGSLMVTSRQAVERSHQLILKRLNQPIALKWTDESSLENVIERVSLSTRGPGLPLGLPIYVDYWGLSEIDSSLDNVIVAPPPRAELPVREHLRRILEPLGLVYQLRDGAVMITSRQFVDETIEQQEDGGFEQGNGPQ